jgi:hypothetical protein
VFHDLLGEGTILRQRPSFAQPCQRIDAIVNRQDNIVPFVGCADDGFHCGHQTGIQGGFPKPTKSMAWGLGVFHSLSFAGENSSK